MSPGDYSRRAGEDVPDGRRKRRDARSFRADGPQGWAWPPRVAWPGAKCPAHQPPGRDGSRDPGRVEFLGPLFTLDVFTPLPPELN